MAKKFSKIYCDTHQQYHVLRKGKKYFNKKLQKETYIAHSECRICTNLYLKTRRDSFAEIDDIINSDYDNEGHSSLLEIVGDGCHYSAHRRYERD